MGRRERGVSPDPEMLAARLTSPSIIGEGGYACHELEIGLGKIRALIDRISTISTVIGWLGLTTSVSGAAGAVGAAVWAVVTGVPIPIVVMAAFCTITAAAYLALIPMAYRALLRAQDIPIGNRPDPQVWRILPQFTLWQAACLLADVEPTIGFINVPSSANGYSHALSIEINSGRMKRIEMHYDHLQVRDGTYVADINTVISKDDLKKFALERDIKRAFLD